MSGAHSHSHAGHSHIHTANKTVLRVAFWIIAGYMAVEIIGGLLTGSLALLSDAGHMFSDALAIGLSLLAFRLGERQTDANNTFGYKRFEILAAALNGLTLIAIAVLIIIEAVERFARPPEIATMGMLGISAVGLSVNIFIACYMHRHADVEENVNIKSAYLHVLGDLLGSVGAVAAALLMMFFGWNLADPIVSLFVALLIAAGGLGILQNTIHILMEGAPKDIDQKALLDNVLQIDGVQGVHDLHIWTLTSNQNMLSAHIVVDGDMTVKHAQCIVKKAEECLKQNGILHSTIQIESPAHQHSESLYCTVNIQSEHCRHHSRHSH